MLGIQPTRPETGYGYIEAGSLASGDALRVRRFTEKPNAEKAAEFVERGNYYWNSGMFLWSARTLANALTEHLPKTAAVLEKIAADLRHEQIRRDVPQALSQVREHQRGLRCPRAALGKRRGDVEYLLSACRFRLERSGLVDGAARAPSAQATPPTAT